MCWQRMTRVPAKVPQCPGSTDPSGPYASHYASKNGTSSQAAYVQNRSNISAIFLSILNNDAVLSNRIKNTLTLANVHLLLTLFT